MKREDDENDFWGFFDKYVKKYDLYKAIIVIVFAVIFFSGLTSHVFKHPYHAQC